MDGKRARGSNPATLQMVGCWALGANLTRYDARRSAWHIPRVGKLTSRHARPIRDCALLVRGKGPRWGWGRWFSTANAHPTTRLTAPGITRGAATLVHAVRNATPEPWGVGRE